MLALSELEKVIGIRAWFEEHRPPALLFRPYGFIVHEEPVVRRGSCTLLILYKKCVDTLHAAKRHPTRLSYAGLKDSEAFTAQYVSAKHGTRLSNNHNVVIAPLEKDGCITRGDVRLNHFAVTIAAPECRKSVVSPNFYGFQRFGTRRPNTHIIGKLLLLGDYGLAYEEMVEHRYPFESGKLGDYERRVSREVRDRLSYARLPYTLPRHILELFINAYQAYLFNLVLSKLVAYYERRVCEKFTRIAAPGCGLIDTLNDAQLIEVYREVMDVEGVSERDFCSAKRLGVKASVFYREPCIKPDYAICKELGELQGEKLYTILFALPRGSYATVWLSESYRLFEPYPDLMPCKLA